MTNDGNTKESFGYGPVMRDLFVDKIFNFNFHPG